MTGKSGFSNSGRNRRVLAKEAVERDGLKFYRLKLECGHALEISASLYGPDRQSRRCPSCRSGQVHQATPLDELPFPVTCTYPGCGAGLFYSGIEVDEHISEEHLPQAVWAFAAEHMRKESA